MSFDIELDRVSHLTAAAVGEPGQRTFYLQARQGDVLVTLLVEKQQVAVLCAHIDELLERIGPPGDDERVEEPHRLEEPVAPLFRVGSIGLGYDADRDLVVVRCEEYFEGEDEEDERDREPGRVRIWATRAQMYALARRGEREVAAGRPRCPMCGEPVDPSGHVCSRSNGHRPVTYR